jgi:hypothetical protein
MTYEIERSADGITFETIGKEISKQDASLANHTWNTENLSGLVYYRLKYLDENSILTYSKIISINNSDFAGIRVFPNPFSGKTTLLLPENIHEEVLVEILDLLGKELFHQKFKSSEKKIELSLPFSSGTYVLKIYTGSEIKVIKLISE